MDADLSHAARPAAYPDELERRLTLADGRAVLVRPVVPADGPELARRLETADADTIYQRFFRYPVHLDAPTLERMTSLDYHDRMAIAAFAVEGGVERDGAAIARYETVEPGVAEVAVVVAPEWRRLGLGTTLLRTLEDAARLRGISRFVAVYLPDNDQIVSLLEAVGFIPGAIDGGLGTATKDLAVTAPPAAPAG